MLILILTSKILQKAEVQFKSKGHSMILPCFSSTIQNRKLAGDEESQSLLHCSHLNVTGACMHIFFLAHFSFVYFFAHAGLGFKP